MIEMVLIGLLKANLSAGAAVLMVLFLRKPVRSRFGARAAYTLWAAPLLAAAAILLPHPAVPTPMTPLVLSAVASANQLVAETAPVAIRARAFWPGMSNLLLMAWLIGAVAAASLLAWRQALFVASLGRLERVVGSDVPQFFRAEHSGVGPALVGLLRPKVVAPADFETRYGDDERMLILAHETAHLRGGDAGVNALTCVVQCVAWFNPLAHLSTRLLRIDQELACDAAVIERFPAARRAYAELLLKTQLFTQPLPLGCHWLAAADHPLRERIAMLKAPLPEPALRTVGLAAVVALSLTGACGVWAAQPGGATGLEPEEAQKLAGPNGGILCKPDANRELHNCTIYRGTSFAKIATPADVAREYPADAKKAGITASVLLKCSPNRTTGKLEGCVATHVYGPAASSSAFAQAAVRVASIYRLNERGKNGDLRWPDAGFMVIPFNERPALVGFPANPAPTHAPPDLPMPARPAET